MNSVQLVGRVGQDPQIFGEGSKRVARVSLATTERGNALFFSMISSAIIALSLLIRSCSHLLRNREEHVFSLAFC